MYIADLMRKQWVSGTCYKQCTALQLSFLSCVMAHLLRMLLQAVGASSLVSLESQPLESQQHDLQSDKIKS